MDKSNPIEIIIPGNGFPNGTVSPQGAACEPLHGDGGRGGGGGACSYLSICTSRGSCPATYTG